MKELGRFARLKFKTSEVKKIQALWTGVAVQSVEGEETEEVVNEEAIKLLYQTAKTYIFELFQYIGITKDEVKSYSMEKHADDGNETSNTSRSRMRAFKANDIRLKKNKEEQEEDKLDEIIGAETPEEGEDAEEDTEDKDYNGEDSDTDSSEESETDEDDEETCKPQNVKRKDGSCPRKSRQADNAEDLVASRQDNMRRRPRKTRQTRDDAEPNARIVDAIYIGDWSEDKQEVSEIMCIDWSEDKEKDKDKEKERDVAADEAEVSKIDNN